MKAKVRWNYMFGPGKVFRNFRDFEIPDEGDVLIINIAPNQNLEIYTMTSKDNWQIPETHIVNNTYTAGIAKVYSWYPPKQPQLEADNIEIPVGRSLGFTTNSCGSIVIDGYGTLGFSWLSD
jgi:hypothetical protein